MRAVAMIAAAAMLLVAACGDKNPNGVDPITGTYVLQSVDGHPLPYVVPGETPSDELALTAGSIVLMDGGRFTMSITMRYTAAGSSTDMTMNAGGTYRVAGASVTFTVVDPESGSSTFGATVSNGTLTVSEEGETWVFRR